ncbi:hypothetical protein K4749_14655 [Streptomyces sp. TRM72054]|uniref:DUF6228 family protein n=1 Tax=Streptomyces sp. TRM72054 TaxID=2870562 RepID=UPI001C8BEBE2|nr:DUF6228 family protein [Streptomyces sp. TRM72054]MBX9394805.1 hypothetical protein [Streptomyces sp. TRM72054]
MTTPDVGTDDEASVTIRCQDNSSVSVRFCDRFSFDEDSVHFAVELQAPGLAARVDKVVAWIWDSELDRLPVRTPHLTKKAVCQVRGPPRPDLSETGQETLSRQARRGRTTRLAGSAGGGSG